APQAPRIEDERVRIQHGVFVREPLAAGVHLVDLLEIGVERLLAHVLDAGKGVLVRAVALGRPTCACAGCTLAAKKPITLSACASATGSFGHSLKRLPRYGRIAVFSVSGRPSSSSSAGTRPSGWIFRYSGVFCSPFARSTLRA